MADVNSAFAARLNDALDYRGVITKSEKIARLTAATGCSARVASKWLSSTDVPRSRGPWLSRIAMDLDASTWWLYSGEPWSPQTGDGGSPRQRDRVKLLFQVPTDVLPKLTRYFVRLNNNDPKALRWSGMFARGEIGIEQILAMA